MLKLRLKLSYYSIANSLSNIFHMFSTNLSVSKMKMQERMKMRSVSFSDEAPPAIPPRTFPPPRAAHRRQTSAESLPLYENSEMNNEVSSSVSKNLRLNSLPRMIPHHRRKILDFNRPSSSLAGHYQYLGDPLPDYANLTNISRRGTFYNQRQNSLKQGWLTFLPFKS